MIAPRGDRQQDFTRLWPHVRRRRLLIENILAETAAEAPRQALDLDGASLVGDLFEAIAKNDGLRKVVY